MKFQDKEKEKKGILLNLNKIFLNPTSGMPGPIRFLFGLENDIGNQSGRFITGVAIVNIICFLIECVYASLLFLHNKMNIQKCGVWC